MGDDDCCCCCCCCDDGCCDCSCDCCDGSGGGSGGGSSFSPGGINPPSLQMNVDIKVERPSIFDSDSDDDEEEEDDEDDEDDEDSSSSDEEEEKLDPVLAEMLDAPPSAWYFEGNPCPGHQFGTGGYYPMGSNDFLGSPTVLPVGKKSRSLLFDFKAIDGSPGWCPLISYGNSVNVHSLFSVGIFWQDRMNGEIMFADGTRKLTKSKIKVMPGNWYRIGVSFNRKRKMVRFFNITQPNNPKCNIQRTRSKKQGKLNTAMDRLIIGSHNGPNMLPYIGHIRRVLFFDKTFDVSIQAHKKHFYNDFPAF
eukprot:TRINITY_DN8111_c1_g1_i5.p1 TRINITY_DN8111_c1_g1~~TRINITY_DN8111_c1_g1_i5.p1  ORF type:complete len:307 (-),score=125.06 TRINITY_DN8111_c1_g1_i5:78-998(-)